MLGPNCFKAFNLDDADSTQGRHAHAAASLGIDSMNLPNERHCYAGVKC